MRQAGNHVALFRCRTRMHTDEIGAVGVDNCDRLTFDADDIFAALVGDGDIFGSRMPRQWNVVEDDVVLRDYGVAHLVIRAREKKYGADPAEEEQRADEHEVVLLHWSSFFKHGIIFSPRLSSGQSGTGGRLVTCTSLICCFRCSSVLLGVFLAH